MRDYRNNIDWLTTYSGTGNLGRAFFATLGGKQRFPEPVIRALDRSGADLAGAGRDGLAMAMRQCTNLSGRYPVSGSP